MIKLKDLILEVKVDKGAYIAHRTNVDEVEPAIFDNPKRLRQYRKGDTFQYMSKNPKRFLGVFKAIDNPKPIKTTKLTSAETKKHAEVIKQLQDKGTTAFGGKTVTHMLRVKRIG